MRLTKRKQIIQFFANLGFLWADLPLPSAIRAGHIAGFDAVEYHWPYETKPELVNEALQETSLRILGLNTARENHLDSDKSLCALPDRKAEEKVTIDQSIAYANAIKCPKIHIMAGFTSGIEEHETFIENYI